MSGLPAWVYDVVAALQRWEAEHPKLHAEFYSAEAGKHIMQPVDACGCAALALVPDDVKVQAAAIAGYLQQREGGEA